MKKQAKEVDDLRKNKASGHRLTDWELHNKQTQTPFTYDHETRIYRHTDPLVPGYITMNSILTGTEGP